MKRRRSPRKSIKRTSRLRYELLEARRLLYGPTEVEPNNSIATSLAIETIGGGTPAELSSLFGSGVIQANDEDYWKFTALAGDRLVVSVDTPGKDLNSFVELQNSAGGVLTSNDNSGPATDSLSVYLVVSSGTYYVRVKGSSASTAGEYQLRVDVARGVAMESDQDYGNDSTGGANALPLTIAGNTRTASIAGTIMGSEGSNRDEDRYQLGFLNAGTQVDLSSRLPQWSILAPLLEVVDSAGNLVVDTNPSDGVFSGVIAADGNYFASVRSARTILNGSLYTYNSTNQSWTASEAAAVLAGGRLVSVNSLQEQQFLVDAFGENTFWIGLNDATTEGTFQWSGGEALTFQNWSGGTPATAGNSASNDYAFFGTTGGAWILSSNGNSFPSVIERPAPVGSPAIAGAGTLAQYVLDVAISDLVPPSVTNITRLPAQGGTTTDLLSSFSLTISEDYAAATVNKPLTSTFNGRTYLLTSTTMSLAQAETLATSLGGHVTSINSAEEQNFLDRTFGFTNFWIGLNDRTTEGTHVWSNGDPVTYTNWATNEPNNGSVDAVFFSADEVSGGKWFDHPETALIQAVIEIVTPLSDTDSDGLTASFDPFPTDAYNGFDLRAAGTDGLLDTSDDQVYLMEVTRTSNRVLGFVVQDGPLGPGNYRFTMTPILTDVLGNPLDGNANGVGGDALVRTFTVSTPSAGLFEGRGNRDFATAVPLNLQIDPLGTGLLRTEVYGYGSIDPTSDADFFKFSAQAGDRVAINAELLSGSLNPRVTLFDPSGNSIADNAFSGPGLTAFISNRLLATSGDYFIRVYRNGGAEGNYQLRVDVARGVAMESDQDYGNDSTGGANTLPLTIAGNTRTASIAGTVMGSEGNNRDEDRYQLGFLNAGTQVDLSSRLPQWSILAPLLEVVDSAGNLVVDTNPSDGIFSGVIATDGNYFASVRSARTILNGSLYTYNSTNQSWTASDAAAVLAGGRLVSVNSLQEQQFLVDAFGESTYWIGLNDATTEGTFQWSGGEALTYQNWSGGTPATAGNSASNDYAFFGTTGGAWILSSNGNSFPSVIERPAPVGSPAIAGAGTLAQYVLDVAISDLVPPSVTNITRLPAQGGTTTDLLSSFSLTISEDYAAATVNKPLTSTFNGRTYLLTNTTMTLVQAETLATSLGGHVTSINSAEEQNFLDRTFGFTNFWIGLNDRTTEGTHVWSNGDPVAYTNWAPNEPNNGSFDAVIVSTGEVTGGKWFDASETSAFQAVIEIVTPLSDTDSDGLTASFDPFPTDAYNGFDLRAAGTDGLFDTSDDQVYMMEVARTSNRVLSFVVQDGPLGPGNYRFTMTPILTDVLGNPLDGNANGVGGDALVRTFTVSTPSAGLFEGRGNRDFATAVPLTLQIDPLGTGLLRTEVYGYGSIDPTSDADYFKFSGIAGDRAAINVDVLSGSFSPLVYLFDGLGNQVGSGNAQSGPGNTAFISNALLATSGDYFVRVIRNGGAEGNYQLRVDVARGVAMESDQDYGNDSTGGANALPLTIAGNTRTASVAGTVMGSEGSNGDEDRYQLGFLNAGTKVDLSSRLPQWSTLAPLLEVVDSAGNLVVDSNPSDGVFSGVIATDGNYFASVRSARTILNGSIYSYNSTNQSWTASDAAAVLAGGRLVSVNSLQEQQFLVDAFGENTYWIGLNDATTDGTFQWSGGEALTFQNWSGGTPATAGNSASNDYAFFGTTGGAWILSSNGNSFPSVIERPAPVGSPAIAGAGTLAQYVLDVAISDLVPPSVTNITRLPAQGGTTTDLLSSFSLTISEDYAAATVNKPLTSTFNGRTYLLTSTTMTLAQAETLATSLGGHVTSINSAEEQNFLDRTFGFTNFWIGLNDRTTEGTHVWSNGDPVAYTNWEAGRPASPANDAVYFASAISNGLPMSGGKWIDHPETALIQAVIEIVTPLSDTDSDGLTASFDPFPTDAYNGFDLRAAGTDGLFDTSDDQVYMMEVTRTSNRVLSFVVQDGPLGLGNYRFTMTPILTDVLGNPLDGNTNGVGGDALVRTFTVSTPSAGLFEGRGNRDFATAVPLTLQLDPLGTGLLRTEVHGYGSIDPTSDADYFKFSGQAGDRVSINVDLLSGSLNPRVTLFDPSGNSIADNAFSGPGLTAFISNRLLATTGDYFVRVIRNGGAEGNYQLRVDVARGVAMESDQDYGNDSTGGANALPLTIAGNTRTASISGTVMGSEGSNRDEDWYQLGFLNAGTQVDLSAHLPQWSTLAPLLEVVDSAGNIVADTNPSDGIFSGVIAADGNYFASVRSARTILNGSLYTYNSTNQSWTASEAAAVLAGGRLVSVNSLQEQQFLVDAFGENTYWIGLNDATTEGTFQWSGGEALTYQNWSGGTPATAGNSASNDYAFFGTTGGAWILSSNGNSFPSVIERPAPVGSPAIAGAGTLAQYVLDVAISDLVPPSVTNITRLPAQGGTTTDLLSSFSLTISEDYAAATVNKPLTSTFNGRTYLLTNTTMTLAQAEALATSLGGHVTSINSAEEQSFLDRTFGFTNFWIGLNDRTTEGTHVWSNGDPVTYTNWAANEPNNGSFDAVFFSADEVSGGKWFDHPETALIQAVIEIATPQSDSDSDGLTASFDPFPTDAYNGFDLRAAGTDGLFDTSDDQVYLLDVTRTNNRVLSFVIQDGPLGPGNYRFTMTPTLTDVLGNPLDGNANGVGGDALVRTFTVSTPSAGLFEGRGNRDFATAVPLTLQLDPLGTGLLRTEVYGYGSIDPTSDADYFKFSGQAGDRVSINVDLLSGSLNPRVALYDQTGTYLTENALSGPGLTAFISNRLLASTGDYFVRVYRNGGAEGNYQVRVDVARGVAMETDSDYGNDSTGGANTLTFTDQGTSKLASIAGAIMQGESGNVDEDYFSLGTVQAGQTVLLSLALPQWSTLEPIVEVRNAAGQVISIVTAPTGGVARADISTSGVFYATLLATGGQGANGQYLLKVAVRATAELDFADLVVTEVTAPATGGSNDAISISWSAGNFGAISLPTSSWQDRVFISRDTIFGNTDDIALGAFTQNRSLAANESYTNTQSVLLPSGISGEYSIFVQVDGFNTVPEFIFDANNVKRSSVRTVVTRNYPDLTSSIVSSPTSAVRGVPFDLSWSVTNIGLDSTVVTQWSDEIIFSTDTILGNADDRVLRTVLHTGLLAKNGSYSGSTTNLLIPGDVPVGTGHLFLRTDSTGAVNENGATTNNSAQVDINVAPDPLLPDLIVSDLKFETTPIQTGKEVTVSWTITNSGNAPTTSNWSDRVTVVNENTGQTIVTQSVPYNTSASGAIAPGAKSPARSTTFRVPDGSTGLGTIRVTVTTDSDGQVSEFNPFATGETNNAAIINAPSVLGPYPELSVTTITPPFTPIFGTNSSISWTVKNSGNEVLANAVSDRVYLSTDVLLDAGDRLLATVASTSNVPLNVGASYSQSATVLLPFELALPSGTYRILVVTDALSQQFEVNEADNVLASSPFDIVRPNGPDLIVDSISTVAEVVAGQSFPIDWVIKNQGDVAATGTWQDQISLSSDATIGNDLAIGTFAFTGTLQPGQTVTRTQIISVPSNVAGSSRIVVRTDSVNSIFELANEGNNASIDNTTINVITPVAPNLIVDSINVPATAFSDRDITVDWVTKNIGPTATNSMGWVDRVFLSLDSILDVGDVQLGSVQNASYLNSGDSYRSTLTAKLPRGIDGNYRIIVFADANNSVPETGFEADNISAASVTRVTLTPPPDLRVTSVSAPANVFSGEKIQVGWTITNEGPGPTLPTTWRDQVFLSFGDNQLDASDRLLNEVFHTGELLPAGNYSVSGVDVTLPVGIAGQAFFIVRTDSGNQVFEHVFETNNVASSSNATTVLLTPPPDLTVTSFNVPTSAIAGQTLVVTYTVTNEGSTVTPDSQWSDVIYLSTDTTLDTATDLLLGVRSRNGVLEAGQSETKAHSFTLPNTLTGAFHVIVSSDNTNVVFELDNANNVVASTMTTSVVINPPDLLVSSVSTTSAAKSGRPFSLSYSVTNNGASPTPISTWNDGFYLSIDETLDSSDLLLGQQLRTGVLAPNQIDPRTATFTLPVDRIGSFFVIAASDITESVFEASNTNNSRALPISIQDDRPELVVKSFVVRTGAGPVSLGSSLAFDYEVENRGVGATFGNTWSDVLVLSSDSTVGNADDLVLGTYSSPSSLAAGSSYSRLSLNFTIPNSVTSGNYQLFLKTDANGNVSESTESNNSSIFVTVTISVPQGDLADLQISSLTVPASVASGTELTVSWTVTNAGQSRTNATAWTDRVWLSRDGVISIDDISLGTFSRTESLPPNQSYTRTINPPINIDLSGSFRIIVETDAANNVFEGTNESNNLRVTSSASDITLTSTADLVVTTTNLPTEITSGRSAGISWTVTNNGATSTETWADSIFLSLDQVFDRRTDIPLGFLDRTGGLAANQQYTASGSFDVPQGLGGRYYFIIVADSTNKVYERDAELNNTFVAASSVNIVHTPPADLVVGDITIPANGSPGQNATISFTVANNGQNPARGSWSDAIYISADDVWDINDGFFGRVNHSGDVLAGGNYTSSLTAPLPGVLPGNYKVIIRSDIRNNIVESNETNNLTASLNRFDIDVPLLQLGVSANGSISRNTGVYYKFAVEANQTVVIEFDSALANGYTELFASFGEVPRRSKADFSGSAPLQTDQRIVISSTQAGTYYVLAFGTDIPVESSAYSIQARVIPFTVFDTSFGAGGSSGNRTIVINGAKFDRTVTASLLGSDGRQIDAVRYTRVNETLLFATFDLRGLPHQQYDVRITKPTTGESTTISNGFSVVNSSGQLRNPTVTAPTFYDDRSPEPIPVTVGWYNDTLNDIPTPLVNFSSTSPFATSYNDALKGNTVNSITYLGYSNSEGPVDVLIPGASVKETFYIRPAGGNLIYPSASYVYTDPTNEYDWSSQLSGLTINDAMQNAIQETVSAFVVQRGRTVAGFRDALSTGLKIVGKPRSRALDDIASSIIQPVFDRYLVTRTTSIAGTVEYPEFDVPVSDLQVTITNDEANFSVVAKVQNDGTFVFVNMVRGRYRLSVGNGAYTPLKGNSIEIRNEETLYLQVPVVKALTAKGRVIDASGSPIEGAMIQAVLLNSSENFYATSNSQGEYAFRSMQPGTYSLIVSSPGFTASRIKATLSSSSSNEIVTSQLTRGARISGVVTNESGAVLLSASVTATRVEDGMLLTSITDNEGNYVLDGIPIGNWEIEAVSRDSSENQSTNVFIERILSIPLNFQLVKGGALAGYVRDAVGNPVKGALLTFSSTTKATSNAMTDETGHYEVRGLELNVQLSIDIQSDGFTSLIENVSVFKAFEERVQDFVLEYGRKVEGFVEDMDGNPVSNAVLTLSGTSNVISAVFQTGPDGRFKFDSLPVGRYQLAVSSAGYSKYLEEISISNGDYVGARIAIKVAGAISGAVSDQIGTLVNNGRIMLLDVNGIYVFGGDVRSNGVFELSNLAPGTYSLLYTSSSFTNTSYIASVIVNPGATTNVQVVTDGPETLPRVSRSSIEPSFPANNRPANRGGSTLTVLGALSEVAVGLVDGKVSSDQWRGILNDVPPLERQYDEIKNEGLPKRIQLPDTGNRPNSCDPAIHELYDEVLRLRRLVVDADYADRVSRANNDFLDALLRFDRKKGYVLDLSNESLQFLADFEKNLDIAKDSASILRENFKPDDPLLSDIRAREIELLNSIVDRVDFGIKLVANLRDLYYPKFVRALDHLEDMENALKEMKSARERQSQLIHEYNERAALVLAAMEKLRLALLADTLGTDIQAPSESRTGKVTELIQGNILSSISARLQASTASYSVNTVSGAPNFTLLPSGHYSYFSFEPANVTVKYDLKLVCGSARYVSTGAINFTIEGEPIRPQPRSVDPNDIIGPIGYGEDKWIAESETSNYMIRFENDALLAQAPAQIVRIVQTLDSDLDARSFRLGQFGFGGQIFEVPENRSYFSTRLDVRSTLGVYVDVVANVDVASREIFWLFTAINPATGEVPDNPLVGFLPPNVTAPEGDGFVTYTVRGRSTSPSGSRVDAVARIFFDDNAPIDTPPIFNTLDTSNPTSALNVMPSLQSDAQFRLSWSGGDGDIGSGLKNYDIFVSENGSEYVRWLAETTLTSAEFAGTPGKTYAFYSVARDNVGNLEMPPVTPDVVTSIFASLTAPSIPTLSAATDLGVSRTDHRTADNRPVFVGTGIPGNQVVIYSNGVVLAQGLIDANGNYSIQPASAFDDGTYTITAEQIDGTNQRSPMSLEMTPPLIIDTIRPTGNVAQVVPLIRNSSVDQFTIGFSEPVSPLTIGNLQLSLNGGPNLLTSSQSLASSDGGTTWTLGNLGGIIQSSGRYILSILATSIMDVAGNALELTPPVGSSYSAEAVLVLHPPTNLPFNQRVIPENTPTTTDVLFGTLSVIDLDTADSFVYALVTGQGSTDNNRFRIVDNQLFLKQGESLDFETKPTYGVRVQVKDSIGNTLERALILSVTNVELEGLSLTLAPATISENGGTATGTVALNGPTTSALTVSLTSSNIAGGTVPATVVIPAGQSSVTFIITAVNNAIADGNKATTITAASSGLASATAVVTVTDDEIASLGLTIAPSSISEASGTATGTVTRNTSTASALTVNLTSSNIAAGTIPASVVIPAGQTSATFTINAVNDAIADGSQSAIVTASATGLASATAQVTVTDDDVASLSLTISPWSITENGGTATGTVTRNTPTTSALTVNLTSSDVLTGTVPASVVIPAGQTSTTFTITAVNDAIADDNQSTIVTASATGLASATAQVTVTDDEVASLGLTISPSSISENGGTATGTVTRNTPTNSALTVNLTSSDVLAGTVPPTVVIPAGQTSATFTINAVNDAIADGSQLTTITASATGQTSASAQVTVTDDEIASLFLVIAPTSISDKVGTAIGTVTRNTSTQLDMTVRVTSSQANAGTFPTTVVIPAGKTSASFTFTAANVDATLTTLITVTADGLVFASDSLTVTDDTSSSWQNPLDRFDVSNDGIVSPVDALLVINSLNSAGNRQLPTDKPNDQSYIDINGDGYASPGDALLVLNILNSRQNIDPAWQNPVDPNDVSGNFFVSPQDALLIINSLNSNGPRQLPTVKRDDPDSQWFIDVNGDGFVTATDALLVINILDSRSEFSGAGEGESQRVASRSVDHAFADATWVDDEIASLTKTRNRSKKH